MSQVWITATPPTPNGDLHVGHMAGPYVAADVLRRFLRADGVPVLMTTGLDDHQSYVSARGQRDGRRPEEVADGYGERIQAAWRLAGVEFDRVVHPRRDPGYAAFVQAFFRRLLARGAIVPRTRPLPHCAACDRWLFEAHAAGLCPHCGAGSGGNACEACGRPNECGDLVEPRCAACGAPAELLPCRRLFLQLAPLAGRLADFWARMEMPPHLRQLCDAMLADGLPEIAVSHPADWGLPVPVDGFEDQVIYVWLEMAPGYLLQADPAAGRPAAGPVQFFGFDNGYFHAVLFPAAFLAAGQDVPLAAAFVVNEFYRLDGLKFSTSRGHAVWACDALGEAGPDALRYHVLRDRPNGRQTSFARADLAPAREHLRVRWNGWLERLIEACDGQAPAEVPAGPAWELLAGRLRRTAAELREAYSLAGFDPRRAVDLLDEVVRCAEDFGHVHEHERHRPGGGPAHRAALAAQVAAAAGLSVWAAPALPAGAGRLAAALGLEPGRPVAPEALAPLAAGAPLRPPAGPIFGA